MVLRTIARELLESVRKSTIIDWTIKGRYTGYAEAECPGRSYGSTVTPDKQEKAVKTVIEHAKLLAEEITNEEIIL